MPTYLSSLLEQYRPTRSLRSSSLDILSVPRSRTKTASRRFSIAAPSVWNSLPATIQAASNVGSFRSQLKTHLYHDHSRYRHFCSFGDSSALQILTLTCPPLYRPSYRPYRCRIEHFAFITLMTYHSFWYINTYKIAIYNTVNTDTFSILPVQRLVDWLIISPTPPVGKTYGRHDDLKCRCMNLITNNYNYRGHHLIEALSIGR